MASKDKKKDKDDLPRFYKARICPNRDFSKKGKKQCEAIIPLGHNEYARCCNYALEGKTVCYAHRKMSARPAKAQTNCMVAVVDSGTGKQRCCHNSTKEGLKRKVEGKSVTVCRVHANMIASGKATKLSRCAIRRGTIIKGPTIRRKIDKTGKYAGFNVVSHQIKYQDGHVVNIEVVTGGKGGNDPFKDKPEVVNEPLSVEVEEPVVEVVDLEAEEQRRRAEESRREAEAEEQRKRDKEIEEQIRRNEEAKRKKDKAAAYQKDVDNFRSAQKKLDDLRSQDEKAQKELTAAIDKETSMNKTVQKADDDIKQLDDKIATYTNISTGKPANGLDAETLKYVENLKAERAIVLRTKEVATRAAKDASDKMTELSDKIVRDLAPKIQAAEAQSNELLRKVTKFARS